MKRIAVFLLCYSLITSCNKKSVAQEPFFVKGGDIGWLSEMEAAGIKFSHSSGQQDDLINVLKGVGMNTIRLRVWVDPTEGWCGQEDVASST